MTDGVRLIPIQDVVPSGKTPIVTLLLVALSVIIAVAPSGALFAHASTLHFVVSTVTMWVFGENVEARLGRAPCLAMCLASALTATQLFVLFGHATVPGLAVAGLTAGLLGAYFVLLPQSRVLMLVPVPPLLVEIPAVILLGMWWMVQFVTFAVVHRRGGDPGGMPAMAVIAAAFAFGAVVCLATRRPITWS